MSYDALDGVLKNLPVTQDAMEQKHPVTEYGPETHDPEAIAFLDEVFARLDVIADFGMPREPKWRDDVTTPALNNAYPYPEEAQKTSTTSSIIAANDIEESQSGKFSAWWEQTKADTKEEFSKSGEELRNMGKYLKREMLFIEEGQTYEEYAESVRNTIRADLGRGKEVSYALMDSLVSQVTELLGQKTERSTNTHILRATVAKLALAATFLASAQGISAGFDKPDKSDSVGEAIELVRTSDATIVTIPALEHDTQDPVQSAIDAATAINVPESEVSVSGAEDLVLPLNITPNQAAIAAIAASMPDKVGKSDGGSGGTTTTTAPSPPTEVPAEPAPAPPTEAPKSPEEMTDEEYIDWLVSQVKVTAEDFKNFTVDESRLGAFDDELSGAKIQPKAFVLHWTAGRYKNGVDQFISAIKGRKGNCCNVMYFIDDADKPNVYRFFGYQQKAAHAAGANSYTQGVEVEAKGLRGEDGYTPEQLRAVVLLAYRFMTTVGIDIKRENFVGHSEVTKGKTDGPAYLMDRLFERLQQLDKDVKGSNIPSSPATPEEPSNPKGAEYDKALNALLEFIASKEGDWNSVNRGVAGDTMLGTEEGRAAYRAIFGDRMLTDLTIREIMQLQEEGKIKAVGKFQLIPSTLNSAVKVTKIDIDRKYDREAQLQLATDYLLLGGKQPALTEYLKGQSDNLHSAIEGLCAEWASMVCNDGNGRYDGTAGNDARGGMAQLKTQQELLEALRQAIIGNEQTMKTDTTATTVTDTTTTSQPQGGDTAKDTEPKETSGKREVFDIDSLPRDKVAHIYSGYFMEDGKVNQEKLDEWLDKLPKVEIDGQIRYRFGVKYIPGEYEGDSDNG